jgi:hypothetical protein
MWYVKVLACFCCVCSLYAMEQSNTKTLPLAVRRKFYVSGLRLNNVKKTLGKKACIVERGNTPDRDDVSSAIVRSYMSDGPHVCSFVIRQNRILDEAIQNQKKRAMLKKIRALEVMPDNQKDEIFLDNNKGIVESGYCDCVTAGAGVIFLVCCGIGLLNILYSYVAGA